MRYVTIGQDFVVQSVIEWDGLAPLNLPPTTMVRNSDLALPGWVFLGGKFMDPVTAPAGPFKPAKLAAIAAQASKAMEFYKPTTGPLAGLVIQTGRPQDQIALDQSLSIYRRQVDNLAGELIGARFRTLDNKDKVVSYKVGYEILVDQIGGSWGKGIKHKAWDLVNQVLDPLLDTKAKLDAIDIVTGWPTE